MRYALLVLLLTSCPFPSAIAETLQGRVTDASGAALAESVIIVQRWTKADFNRLVADDPVVLHPDNDGRYTVTVEPGIYDIFVSCGFCTPQLKQVKVVRGKVIDFRFSLKMSRYVGSVE